MGRTNDVLQDYLDNNVRFADFINGAYYRGEQVINAKGLAEASERYNVPVPEPEDGKEAMRTLPGKRLQRYRDVKKQYQDSGTIRILALENQNKVDYTMPFRCMQYDAIDYQKQLKALREQHSQEANAEMTSAERLCGVMKEDRLIPVYTLCLYHGAEEWNGPRTLKDMMDFGDDADGMSRFFQDYPMRLYCVNDENDFSTFHTGLRELFTALRYRGDPKALQKLMEQDEHFRHLDAETAEVMAVLLDMPEIWDEREHYMSDRADEEDYDMCYAVEKWKEDALAKGRIEGRSEGRSEGFTKGCRETRARINLLNVMLAEQGRINDILLAANDIQLQEKFLAELCV